MTPIREQIEIARPPEDVFAYLDDLSRHGEWQSQIESIRVETDGPTRVGTRAVETRRLPVGSREFPYEITEHDPPRRVAFQVTDGPVRPVGRINLEPTGTGTRYSMELDFEGHGVGKVMAPLAQREARKQVPLDLARLKERLESGAAPGTAEPAASP